MLPQRDSPRLVTLAFTFSPRECEIRFRISHTLRRYTSISVCRVPFLCHFGFILLLVHLFGGFTQGTRHFNNHPAQHEWPRIPLGDLFGLHHQRSRTSPSSKSILRWLRPPWHTRRWSSEWMSLRNLDLQQRSVHLLLPKLHILRTISTWCLLLPHL